MVALVTNLQRAGCNGEMVLAALQKVQARTRFPRPSGAKQAARPRARTPPRDPKDNKCANCNLPGHQAKDCLKPKVATTDRKCHLCNKTGHLARNCPNKDAARLAAPGQDRKLAIKDGNMRAFVIQDEEGFTTVPHRPKPHGTMISELPVRQTRGNQYVERTGSDLLHSSVLDILQARSAGRVVAQPPPRLQLRPVPRQDARPTAARSTRAQVCPIQMARKEAMA